MGVHDKILFGHYHVSMWLIRCVFFAMVRIGQVIVHPSQPENQKHTKWPFPPSSGVRIFERTNAEKPCRQEQRSSTTGCQLLLPVSLLPNPARFVPPSAVSELPTRRYLPYPALATALKVMRFPIFNFSLVARAGAGRECISRSGSSGKWRQRTVASWEGVVRVVASGRERERTGKVKEER